jgi:hypothetical protein
VQVRAMSLTFTLRARDGWEWAVEHGYRRREARVADPEPP